VAETAVEAVNDGKLAAWTIHKYLQGLHGVQVGIFNPRILLVLPTGRLFGCITQKGPNKK
jgi:hypothetical protein